MTYILDVRGFPEDKVSYLQQLVEKWRREEVESKDDELLESKDIVFATHDSDVIGGVFE